MFFKAAYERWLCDVVLLELDTTPFVPWRVARGAPPWSPRPRFPMAAGLLRRQPSMRRSVTSSSASCSLRIAVLLRWLVDLGLDRLLHAVQDRKMVELRLCRRKAEHRCSSAALFQHAVSITSSGALQLGLLGIMQSRLQLQMRLLRLLQPRAPRPWHRARLMQTWRCRKASDNRRRRALRARSMRCCRMRVTHSRRASRVCSAARTRTPPQRRSMLRPAARSEWLRLRGRRSGSRAHTLIYLDGL